MSVVSKRYAEGLSDMAVELNAVNKFKEQLEHIVNNLLTEEIMNILNYPDMPNSEKKEIIKTQMSEEVDEHLTNFLLVLLDNDRLEYITDIVKEYKKIADEYSNVLIVEVVSAFELDQDQIEKIKQKVERMYDCSSIELKVNIDPEVIGGIKVKIGDTIIDGTIKTKLENIEKTIKESNLY